MKKNRLTNYLKTGILFFGITLLLWSCEKEGIEFNQTNNFNLAISNQYDSEIFKERLPHKFTVNWSDTEKQFSEDLNANFYEFSLIYSIKHFNPTTVNKISSRKYYHKYKLIAKEKENGEFEFYLAKFYQEKNSKTPNLETSSVSLNQNTGYNGLMQLYNTEGNLTFSKYIYLDNTTNAKVSLNKKHSKTTVLKKTNNQPCQTIVTAHYRDWFQNVYDAYGNFLGTVPVYTELTHYTTRVECDPNYVEPAYVNAVAICQGTCSGYLTEALFCPNGDPVDENGNCDGYGEDLGGNDAPSPEDLLQAQQDYLVNQLSLVRNSVEMNWVYNNLNNEAIAQLYNYLQIYNVVGNVPVNINNFATQVISAWIATNNTAEIDWEEHIINQLTGKSLCVYNKLIITGINNHNLIRDTFIEFGNGNFRNANLTYKLQSPLVNTNGVILNGASDKIGNNYIVILNSDRINNRSPIEIAKTIVHESLHALLKKRYYTGTESFIELFGKYMQENTGSNNITHAIMRDHYVASISNTLKQFDNYQESQQFYDDLAWEGLHQYLSQSDIDRILLTINQARNRGLNCN